MKRLVPIAAVLVLWVTEAASAAPIRALADLQLVRVYEQSFNLSTTDFSPDDSALTTRLPDPLSATSHDFSYLADEYYDVFYSDSDGTPNPDGAFLTIEGVWRFTGSGLSGSMNISEVALVFGGANPVSVFADFVSSVEYGMGNVTPGSAAAAVDHNLATFPVLGMTSSIDLSDRMRLTVGWNAYSVPEPSAGACLVVGALALTGLPRVHGARRPRP